jgi:mono/diheme cytochrome c family protein
VVAQTKTVNEVPIRSITSVNGAEVYAEYCAVCHGKDGRGGGPAAVALKQAPTDLTVLARKNGGKFPILPVQQSITNPDISAHGSQAMPVWGQLFITTPDNAATGELRIYNLTKYIESLQK